MISLISLLDFVSSSARTMHAPMGRTCRRANEIEWTATHRWLSGSPQANDGTWHIVNHQQSKGNVCGSRAAGSSCGAHFFARDPRGPWTMSRDPVYANKGGTVRSKLGAGKCLAFELTAIGSLLNGSCRRYGPDVTLANGTRATFQTRQRPATHKGRATESGCV